MDSIKRFSERLAHVPCVARGRRRKPVEGSAKPEKKCNGSSARLGIRVVKVECMLESEFECGFEFEFELGSV